MAPNNSLQPPRPQLQAGQRVWSGLSIISKRSLHSFTTSSFEADDERSEDEATTAAAMSRSDSSDDGEGESSRPRLDHGAPQYSGYDARPTSSKELMGWYAYGFASETFVICGMGMSGRAFFGRPRARIPIAGVCSVSHPRASSKTDDYREQAPSSPSCSNHSLARMAFYSMTLRNPAATAIALAKVMASASSTFLASPSTQPASPCIPFQSAC
jgi:hypothetical protein